MNGAPASLALGLGVLLIATGALWAVDRLALGPIRNADAAIADLHSQLFELRGRHRAAAADLDRQRTAQTEFSQEDLFVGGVDAAASASMVQEQIRGFVAEAGGVVLSSQATTEDATGGSARIQVILRARISEDSIFAFLRRLEENRPRIIVASLDIHPASVSDGQPPLEFAGVLLAFHLDAH